MAYMSQETKKELAPAIKEVLKKYKMKGSIAVRHHSALVVNVTQGPIEFNFSHGDGYTQVNEYHIDSNYSGVAREFLTELLAAMKGDKWFDKSDPQTDYFHTAYYVDVNLGQYHKPYKLVH